MNTNPETGANDVRCFNCGRRNWKSKVPLDTGNYHGRYRLTCANCGYHTYFDLKRKQQEEERVNKMMLIERQKSLPVGAFPGEEGLTRKGAFKLSSIALRMFKDAGIDGPEKILFKTQRELISKIPYDELPRMWGKTNMADAQDEIAGNPKTAMRLWMKNAGKVSPKLGKLIRAFPENSVLYFYATILRVVGRDLADIILRKYFSTGETGELKALAMKRSEKKESKLRKRLYLEDDDSIFASLPVWMALPKSEAYKKAYRDILKWKGEYSTSDPRHIDKMEADYGDVSGDVFSLWVVSKPVKVFHPGSKALQSMMKKFGKQIEIGSGFRAIEIFRSGNVVSLVLEDGGLAEIPIRDAKKSLNHIDTFIIPDSEMKKIKKSVDLVRTVFSRH